MACRILVIDDSPQFRRTVSELLADRGFELLAEADDGPQALDAASRYCPDGALVDINLPGPDGFAVAASLAALCPFARIVLTSADVDQVSASAVAACGATAFVPKQELATADLSGLFTG